MRNSVYILILLSVALVACNDDMFNVPTISKEGDGNLVATRAIIQTTSPVFDWEDNASIALFGYRNVILPWYNAADANIPSEILEDYKKEDGWELVYNLCTESAAATYGKYYLIFYNKLRGILRVFYYDIYDVTTANTTFWQLSFTKPTSMLNSIGHFTTPMNTNSTFNVYTTNISSVESKGISRGWNCFDVELCYDPNSSSVAQKMGIRSYDVTQGKITTRGSLQLDSEGTIVSTGTAPRFPVLSNMIDAGVSGFGKELGKFVHNKLDSAKMSPLISTPISEIVSTGSEGLLKSGINFLFGSFLTKKTTTTQTLKIRTTGTIEAKSDFTMNSNTNINPLVSLVSPGSQVESTDYFLPSYNEPLGVWNLVDAPLLRLSSGVIWEKNDHALPSVPSEEYIYTRLYKLVGGTVQINPAVLNCISDWKVSYKLMYYESLKKDVLWGKKFFPNYGYAWDHAPDVSGKKVYDDNGDVFLADPDLSGFVNYHGYNAQDVSRGKKEMWFQDNVPVENPNFVIKVMVTLYPKSPYNTTPIVSTRTYLPEYKIDKNLLSPVGW